MFRDEYALHEKNIMSYSTVTCPHEGCEYSGYPAWLITHKASEHPTLHSGYCAECGGKSDYLVMTMDGLMHRYGRICDEVMNARHEARLNAMMDEDDRIVDITPRVRATEF